MTAPAAFDTRPAALPAAPGGPLPLPALLSPAALCLVSFLLATCSALFPRRFYEQLIGERDFAHLNIELMLLVGLCCAAFIVGTWITAAAPSLQRPPAPREYSRHVPLALLIATDLLLALNILSILRGNPDIVTMLILQEGAQLKQRDELQQSFGLAAPMVQAALWWFVLREQAPAGAGNSRRLMFGALVGITVLLFLTSATLRLSRGDLIPFFVGTAIAFSFRGAQRRHIPLVRQLSYFGAAGLGIALIFIAFSMLRGADSAETLLSDLVGYTIASFNRLAALLDGQMHFPYGGTGVYFSGFVSFNESFSRLLPLAEWLDLPTFNTMWESEFDAVGRAGLNENLIWATAFGYLYSEVGWFTPWLFIPYGALAQWAWIRLAHGSPIAATVYPWIAFCVLFWLGTNFLLDTKFFVILIIGMLIHGLDRPLTRRVATACPASPPCPP